MFLQDVISSYTLLLAVCPRAAIQEFDIVAADEPSFMETTADSAGQKGASTKLLFNLYLLIISSISVFYIFNPFLLHL